MELGGRFERNLYIEENQQFFLYLGAGFMTQQVTTSSSGYILESGMGSRFFLPGLPNFGLNLCGGLKLTSAGGVEIKTDFRAGMNYYF